MNNSKARRARKQLSKSMSRYVVSKVARKRYPAVIGSAPGAGINSKRSKQA